MASILALWTQAATFTEDFEDVTVVDDNGNPVGSMSYGTGLSNGWKVVGGNIYSSKGWGNYGLWSTAHSGSKSLEASYGSKNSAFVVIPTQLAGELKFWARKTSSSSSTKGTLNIWEVTEADGTYTQSGTLFTQELTKEWTEYTIDLGVEGKLIAINMSRAAIDDITYSTAEPITTPLLSVSMDGEKVKTGYTHNFGLVDGDAQMSLTIANAGVGTLNAQLTASEGYTLSASEVAVEAGQETTVELTQTADAYGLKRGSLTIEAEGVDTLTLNLLGIVRDPAKMYVNFDSIPEGWTLNNSDYASIEDGALKAAYWYAAELTSPRISVAEGEQLYFRYKSGITASYQKPTLNLYYSVDGASWTQVGDNFAADATDEAWHDALVDGVPATARYIMFSLKYIYLDDIYGFSLPQEAIMEAAISDTDFGMTEQDSTVSFVIRNTGARMLEGLKATVGTDAFTVSIPETIDAKAEGTMTVTMSAAVKGMYRDTVEITANGQDTVRFAVEGFVIDKEAMTVRFSTDSLPRGWVNNGWTLGEGKAYAGYGEQESRTLTSPQLVINEGDILALRASKEYETGFLRLYASSDQGESWTLVSDFAEEMKAETMKTLVVSGMEAGKTMLRFDGSYANLEIINGFHIDDNAPKMRLTMEGEAVNDNDSIGFGTTKEPIARTFEVSNAGTGTLNVRIAVSDTTQFAVSDSLLSVAQDETKTFTVTMPVGEPFGMKSATLSVVPTNEGLKAINLKLGGETRDASLWSEDFENGISDLWTNHGFTVESPYYGNGTAMAFATSSDTTSLVTPRLKAKKGDKLIFQALLPWSDEHMTVEYSTDEQQTWTTDSIYQYADNYTLADLTFTAPADGFYFLRFSGAYCYVDNFYGFRYAAKAHDVAISSTSMPENVYQYVETSIAASLHELNGRDEMVSATLLVNGEEAQTLDSTALAADSEQQFAFVYRSDETADSVTFQIRFDYDGSTLTTDIDTVAFINAPVVSEAGNSELAEATYPALVLRLSTEKGWNTISLPFALDNLALLKNPKAYKVTGIDGEQLTISGTTALEAGYPYLLLCEEETVIDSVLYNIQITAAEPLHQIVGDNTFYATFDSIPSSSDMLLLDAGMGAFTRPAADEHIGALHGYIVSQDAEVLYLLSDDGTVYTGISTTQGKDKDGGEIYDLGGRRVEKGSLSKGVYIRNGKKFIKK